VVEILLENDHNHNHRDRRTSVAYMSFADGEVYFLELFTKDIKSASSLAIKVGKGGCFTH